jgi:transposase-like protein
MAYWITMEKAMLVWQALNAGNSIRQTARMVGVNLNTVMMFRRRLIQRAEWRKQKGFGEKANN